MRMCVCVSERYSRDSVCVCFRKKREREREQVVNNVSVERKMRKTKKNKKKKKSSHSPLPLKDWLPISALLAPSWYPAGSLKCTHKHTHINTHTQVVLGANSLQRLSDINHLAVRSEAHFFYLERLNNSTNPPLNKRLLSLGRIWSQEDVYLT